MEAPAQRGEGGAELAPVVRAVVQRLGEPGADRGIPLVPVLLVDLRHDLLGVATLAEERRPRPTIGLHRIPELIEIIDFSSIRRAGLPVRSNRYQESDPTRWRSVRMIGP